MFDSVYLMVNQLEKLVLIRSTKDSFCIIKRQKVIDFFSDEKTEKSLTNIKGYFVGINFSLLSQKYFIQGWGIYPIDFLIL